MTTPPPIQEKIARLREQGTPLHEIARIVGVSMPTVRRYAAGPIAPRGLSAAVSRRVDYAVSKRLEGHTYEEIARLLLARYKLKSCSTNRARQLVNAGIKLGRVTQAEIDATKIHRKPTRVPAPAVCKICGTTFQRQRNHYGALKPALTCSRACYSAAVARGKYTRARNAAQGQENFGRKETPSPAENDPPQKSLLARLLGR